MRTIYAACLSRVGLSVSEAANRLRIPTRKLKAWRDGSAAVPQKAWDDLRQYEVEISDEYYRILDDAASQTTEETAMVDAAPSALSATAIAILILESTGKVSVDYRR